MTIIVDGTIGTVNSLVTTSEDSRGNKLAFRKDANGIYTSVGSDGKKYTIDPAPTPPTMAKISVSTPPETE